ncbi:MAG: hypothetical protein CBC77_002575 [Euryarchaeota archaeon TMED117]|nr:MAG: hypothetical protein CBC77_002575 [Euryarchaeota archaeon TMED117]|tara:strand:- start:1464 stop:1955 length:492 start_codon:yes stop_codon:yes gene_type:complete
MELSTVEQHPWAKMFPTRLPVWWCRTGESKSHPDLEGVTGKTVILRFEKKFGRIEKIAAKLFRAPKELRRPLLDKNSVLWELCNGKRTFEEICQHMSETYHEEVSPVVHRTQAGLQVFINLNVLRLVSDSTSVNWNTKPGHIPPNQQLDDVTFEVDLEVRNGD